KNAALLPLPFAPWRHFFSRGRISRAARSLQRTANLTDPSSAAGAGQTAVAVAAAAIAVGGGLAGGLQSTTQRVAATHAVRPAQVVTSTRLWPGPPRTLWQQPAQSGRPSHRAAKPTRRHGPARPSSTVPTKPRSSHQGSTPAPSSPGNTNPSTPLAPSAPGLPPAPTSRLPSLSSTTQLPKTTGLSSTPPP